MMTGLCAVLTLAASADAATIAVVDQGKNDIVLYQAEPGEENRLKAESAAGVITVRDTGAQVIAGNECVQVSAHEATCDRNNVFPNQALAAELGNRDDRADATTGILWQQLDGGTGGDDLEGGDSFDQFVGDRGADRIDGAGGSDFVGYFLRPDDLDITLGDSASNDGGVEDGSGDRLLRIESATGGDGDDKMLGTDGENRFAGGPGADVLEGFAAEDELFGGEGADILRGGAGTDEMQPQDGADSSFGGAGADIAILSGDGRADLFEGGGDPGDKLQLGTGSFRVELDGKPNDGLCDQTPCATSGEGDDVGGFLEFGSAFGSDLLIGSKRDETIRPSLGADVVKAKGGDDTITLTPGDGADDVSCGGGMDAVTGEEPEDTISPDCET